MDERMKIMLKRVSRTGASLQKRFESEESEAFNSELFARAASESQQLKRRPPFPSLFSYLFEKLSRLERLAC